MDRRTFLGSLTLGTVSTGSRTTGGLESRSLLELDEDDTAVAWDVAAGHYRQLGMVPETDEIVVTVARAAADRVTLTIHTIEAYTTPALEPETEPALQAPARAPTIRLVGRTPYRVVLLPSCEDTPPSCTTFIRFAAAVSLGVHLRRHRRVDEVVLVERAGATASET